MLSELLALNKKGIIPAPFESEAQFFARVQNSFEEELEEPLSQEEWKEAHECTNALFGFSADWVKAFYSKRKLPFWQGAVTWLGSPPLIQLHPRFKSGTHLKMYGKREVLAHEAVHAMRTPLNADRFEEHFAYLTSKKKWRSCLGPLFRSSGESTFFLSLLMISTVASCASVWINIPDWMLSSLFMLPGLAFFFGLIRLYREKKLLMLCEKNLSELLTVPPLFVMARLTDEEIVTLSKLKPTDIPAYVTSARAHSLRWKILSAAYFPFLN